MDDWSHRPSRNAVSEPAPDHQSALSPTTSQPTARLDPRVKLGAHVKVGTTLRGLARAARCSRSAPSRPPGVADECPYDNEGRSAPADRSVAPQRLQQPRPSRDSFHARGLSI